MDPAAALDARLLLLDLHGQLHRRAGRALAWRPTTQASPSVVEEVEAALSRVGDPSLRLPDTVRLAFEAPAPVVPLPSAWTDRGEAMGVALASVERLIARLDGLGAWRPLVGEGRRVRFRRVARQAYTKNVAAG